MKFTELHLSVAHVKSFCTWAISKEQCNFCEEQISEKYHGNENGFGSRRANNNADNLRHKQEMQKFLFKQIQPAVAYFWRNEVAQIEWFSNV